MKYSRPWGVLRRSHLSTNNTVSGVWFGYLIIACSNFRPIRSVSTRDSHNNTGQTFRNGLTYPSGSSSELGKLDGLATSKEVGSREVRLTAQGGRENNGQRSTSVGGKQSDGGRERNTPISCPLTASSSSGLSLVRFSL